VALEARGIPTVILCTEEFEALARLRLEATGLPPARLVALPHPLAGLPAPAVRARAAAALPLIAWALTPSPLS
jgi:hypothetical protein